jgi:hypothetical protein
MVRIGPAGWKYTDWNGIVYPKPKGFDELEYISRYFDTGKARAGPSNLARSVSAAERGRGVTAHGAGISPAQCNVAGTALGNSLVMVSGAPLLA